MRLVIRLLAPLTHQGFGGASIGNAVAVRRLAVVSARGMPRVPAISGNSVRGCLRRIVMRDLLERAGLTRDTMPAAQWDRLYAALANGGHLEASEMVVKPDEIRELRRALPPLSLFGSALYSYMLPGHMSVGWCWPRCRETVEGGLVSCGNDVPYAEELVEEIGLVRHIDRTEQDPEVSGVTPMPTTVEAISAGAVFESVIRFARHSSPLERSCAAWAVSQIQTLGGKGGTGFGRVEVDVSESEDNPNLYLEWASACGPVRAALLGLAEKLERKKEPKKGAKAKPAKTAPTEPVAPAETSAQGDFFDAVDELNGVS